ncbi:hypothetical protein GUJ93_ZPchr0574g11 [Zizania palustris]|uniref:Uncharacterized protein n=1 Tax=Zizania palustris TaxID=103762 RepID=A0A8J5T7B2_ZIZPA|nr:hypothetical protein GUJ93_ZPchr0574g11 [Zizania palustris]
MMTSPLLRRRRGDVEDLGARGGHPHGTPELRKLFGVDPLGCRYSVGKSAEEETSRFPHRISAASAGSTPNSFLSSVSRADGLLGLLDSSTSPLYGLSSGDVIIQKCGGGGTAFAL